MSTEEAIQRYQALAKAVRGAVYGAIGSALTPASAVTIAVAFLGSVLVGFLGITDALTDNLEALLGAAATLLAVFATVFGIALWRAYQGAIGDMIDVVAWWNHENEREWAGVSPDAGVPRTPGQARRWLETHPELDANLPQRCAAQMMAGDYMAARDTVSRYRTDTAFQRHQRASDTLELDLLEGRKPAPEEVDDVYRGLGEEHRVHAITCRAAMEATAAVLAGGDWRAPFVDARRHLPPEAARLGRRRFWLITVVIHVALVAILSVAGAVGVALLF